MRHSAMVLIAGCLGTALIGGRTPAARGSERTAGPVVGLCSAGQAAVQSTPARVPGEWRDASIGVIFSAAQPGPSRMIVKARAAGFSFEKTVVPSGETEMRVVVGGDQVTLSLGATTLRVTRGETGVTIDPRAPTDDEVAKLRALLANSKAVHATRALAAHYESLPVGEEGPYAISMLIDGAVLGFLSGDPGALPRIARRLATRRAVSVQHAAFRGQGRFTDCVGEYESTVGWAWGEYVGCVQGATDGPWYLRGINMDFCGVEWTMRAEGAVFQFATCQAWPKV